MTVIDDIEDALASHWSQLGEWPRGELHDDDGLLWFQTPIRHLPYNGVIRTRLGTGPTADETIAAVLERFRDRDADCFWFVHPSASPHDLADRLTAHGLQVAERITCMSLDLLDRSGSAPRGPADVAVRAVLDERDVQAYSDLTISYWGIPRASARSSQTCTGSGGAGPRRDGAFWPTPAASRSPRPICRSPGLATWRPSSG